MDVTNVDFAAFGEKHIYLVNDTASSSDVMTDAVTRLTGRAAISLGEKGKNNVLTGLFAQDTIDQNKASYTSGTVVNTLIMLTSGAKAAWAKDILDKAKLSTSDELHVTTEIKSGALVNMGLTKVYNGQLLDRASTYGGNIGLTGGYGVKVTVLVKIESKVATVVHLQAAESITHSIPASSLQNQSAIFTSKFLDGLGQI